MNKGNKDLIDAAINNLDWESIFKTHNSLERGIGGGNYMIPGVKKKNFSEGITIKDLKRELRNILKYMISNDINALSYECWDIFWTNGEWIKNSMFPPMEDFFEEEMEGAENVSSPSPEINSSHFRSKLEIFYSIQKIVLTGYIDGAPSNKKIKTNNEPLSDIKIKDINGLKTQLEKAILTEDYELAHELKKLINRLDNEK